MVNNASGRIRVAFFSEDFSRRARGTALVIQKLAEQFINNFSDRIELILIRKEDVCDNPLIRKIRNIEIKVHKLPFFPTLFSYLLFFFNNRDKFDVVMFNRNIYPGFWMLNARAFILLLHDASISPVYKEKLTLANRFFHLFLKYIGKHFLDAIIGVSNDARDGIIKHLKVSPSKVFSVYNGVNDNFRQFSDQEKSGVKLFLAEKYKIHQPYILDVSRLDPHKNIHTLIDAFLILKAEFHIPHKLVIVGGRHMPEYTKMIESKIKNYNLEKEIIIAPFIEDDDLPAVYNLADILIFPSFMEGFGLPLVEAMKCGTPIIASDLPVMAEITDNSALLADPRRADLLADKIFELLNDVSLKQKLIKKGLERSHFFSWTKTAQKMINIYENCLHR